jgi:hypothetical protein
VRVGARDLATCNEQFRGGSCSGQGRYDNDCWETIINQWFALTLAPAMGPKVSLVRLPMLVGSGHVAGTRLQQNHGMNQIDREQQCVLFDQVYEMERTSMRSRIRASSTGFGSCWFTICLAITTRDC